MLWQARQGVIAGRGFLDPAIVSAATTWDSGNKGSGITLSGGDLVATGSASNSVVKSTTSHSTGKYYYEATITNFAGAEYLFGIASTGFSLAAGDMYTTTTACCVRAGDAIYFNGAALSGFLAGTTGDVMGFAIDLDALLFWANRNGGAWTNSGNPAAGTGGASIAALSGGPWFAACCLPHATTFNVLTANFGGSAYGQTPPAGFGNW